MQVAEMAVLLGVLARSPTLAGSLTMQGIFMVRTAAGDLIPGQLGALCLVRSCFGRARHGVDTV